MRRLFVALFLIMAVQAISGPVSAGHGSTDRGTTERAREHFEQAQKEYDLGNWDAAVREFSLAYGLRPDPILLYNMAQAYRRAGNAQRAVDLYKNYLLKDPKSPQRADVEQRIERLQKQLEEERAARASVPAAAAVEPPQQAAADTAESDVATEHQAPAAPAASDISGPMPTPSTAAMGGSVAAVSPASGEPHVAVQPASGRGLRIAGIVTGSAGLLGIGAGAFFGWRTQSLSDSVSHAARYNPSDAQSGKNAAVLQWIGYGAGGAALVTGALLYWRGRKSAAETSVGLVPVVGPGTVGLASAGTF